MQPRLLPKEKEKGGTGIQGRYLLLPEVNRVNFQFATFK